MPMSDTFLHGVQVLEIDSGARPIKTVSSGVIGIIGTAPDADANAFPLNTPVLISGSLQEASGLDTKGDAEGTLPNALDLIMNQIGALVVVVRVEDNSDSSGLLSNVIGGVNSTNGKYEGVHAFLSAQTELGVQPRILIAPGFTDQSAVVAELKGICEQMRAIGIIDGPSTTDAAAQTYAGNFGDKRLYMIDPKVTVYRDGSPVYEPASSVVAGLIAKTDNDKGFWHSPSNQTINGITGTERAIDFQMGDTTSRANVLNGQKIATIIREDGYRLWGNLTLSSDTKWQFISVVRTADIINDSLLRAHLWAVDRNINKTYFDDVAESVNAYLRTLQNLGAILGGTCWADPDLNSEVNLQAGKVYFNFDFTPPAPAQTITFSSYLTNDYFAELV